MDYDALIGEVRLFPYNFTPNGWMPCNGAILNTRDNMALYSLIGNTYGGDGTNTFALPNLSGKEPIPTLKYYIAVIGLYPPRQ